MLYSCCAQSKDYYDIQDAGYDAIVLSAAELAAQTKQAFLNTREMLRNGKTPCSSCNDFGGAELRLCGPGFDLQAVQDYTALLAERSAMLQIKSIGVGAPLSRMIPANYDRSRARDEFQASFNAIADELSAAGVRALLEALSTPYCNMIETTREGLEFVRELHRDDVGLVYDIYHASVMGEDPADYLEAADLIPIVHIAQGVGGKRHYLSWAHYAQYEKYLCVIRRNPAAELSVEAFSSDMLEQLSNTLAIMKALGAGEPLRECTYAV